MNELLENLEAQARNVDMSRILNNRTLDFSLFDLKRVLWFQFIFTFCIY